MRRRDFISLIGGAAATWPLTAHTQQAAMPVIGFLSSVSPNAYPEYVDAFREGLKSTNYVEGQNVKIEFRWAEGQYDRLPALASDLVRRHVAVIATSGGDLSALAAKEATSTIPIVFSLGGDPIKFGLVKSFNQPGGNATGVRVYSPELIAKRLQMLREIAPKAAIMGMLANPKNALTKTLIQDIQAAARDIIGREVYIENAHTEDEIDTAFSNLVENHVDALVVQADPFFTGRRDQIAALAAKHGIPAIYQFKESVLAGGLISYGPRSAEAFRQVGIYTGRILKGASPADLPVVQPTQLELAINVKAAKALGLEIPPSIIARADEVIE
jgi:putative ABC transport system substrate-binding protein